MLQQNIMQTEIPDTSWMRLEWIRISAYSSSILTHYPRPTRSLFTAGKQSATGVSTELN